ncbi:MAG: class I SAM-dependent methyltransferase [Candidatus Omnitrophota bacterium]
MKNSTIIYETNLFEFMANDVGILGCHPGGKEANQLIGRACGLKKDQFILDVGCGKASSACYFAQQFGCRVTGIDKSEHFINMANQLVKQNKLQNEIQLKVANAEALPLNANTFDAVVAQALLIVVENTIKDKIIRESIRALKPGGYIGFHELSWFKFPPPEVLEHISTLLWREYVGRILTFEDWENQFKTYGIKHTVTIKKTIGGGIIGFLGDEGIRNGLKVMWRTVTHPKLRVRLMNVWEAFSKYNEYLGYGIYSFKKE